MYLLGLILLAVLAVNFGVLLFQYINIYVPDVLTDRYAGPETYRGPLRWALSSLVIVFPVFKNFFLVHPQLIFQIRMRPIHALVNYRDNYWRQIGIRINLKPESLNLPKKFLFREMRIVRQNEIFGNGGQAEPGKFKQHAKN